MPNNAVRALSDDMARMPTENREISTPDRAEDYPETAFSRFDGCLYTRGWHTAEAITDEGGQHTGH